QFVGSQCGMKGVGVMLFAQAPAVLDTQQTGSGRGDGTLPFIYALCMDELQRLPVMRGFYPGLGGMRQESAENELAGLRMEAKISKRIVTPGLDDEIELGD